MDDRLKKLNQLHVDVWHLHKKYFHTPTSGTEQDWDNLITDYQELEQKYKNDDELDMIRYHLVRAVVDTLDTRYYKVKGVIK